MFFSQDPLEELKKEYKELKEDLQCPVCLDLFKKPIKTLPCLHSFCSSCLDQHIASASTNSSTSSSLSSSSSSNAELSPLLSITHNPFAVSGTTGETFFESSAPFQTSPALSEANITGDPEVKCPVCRRLAGNVSSIETNSFLHLQLDKLEDLKIRIKKLSGTDDSLEIKNCESCESSEVNHASVFCRECNLHLCEGCHRSHSKFLKTHTVVDIQEDYPLTIVPLKCQFHNPRVIELFCTKCDVPLCTKCLDEPTHESHNIKTVSGIVDKRRSETNVLVSETENRRQDIEKSLSLVGQMQHKIQTMMISEKEKISQVLDDLKEKIEIQKEKLLADLERRTTEKLKRLNQQQKELEADLECLENSVKVSRSIVKNATDDHFAAHVHRVTDQLTRLKEDKELLQPPVETTHLEIVVESPFDFSPLINGGRIVEIKSEEIKESLKTTMPLIKYETCTQSVLQLQGKCPKLGSRNESLVKVNSVLFHRGHYIVCDKNLSAVWIFDLKGNIVATIGEPGSDNGKFRNPTMVTTNNKGDYVVCDTSNNRIQVFDENWNFIRAIGMQGGGPAQFSSPTCVAVNSKNELVVCDTNNHRLQFFNEHGVHLKSFGTHGNGNSQFNSPSKVFVTVSDEIIVLDNGTGRVQWFDREMNFKKIIGMEPINGSRLNFHTLFVDIHGFILMVDTSYNLLNVYSQTGDLLHSVKRITGSFLSQSTFTQDDKGRLITCSSDLQQLYVFENGITVSP